MELKEKIQAVFDELGLTNLSVFDIEVFKYNWLVSIYELDTGTWHDFWDNDIEIMRLYLEENENILSGFNIKHYDNPVVMAMLNDYDVCEIKAVNDKIIIDGKLAMDIEECRGQRWYSSFDLMDDTQVGTSLKGFEAHMGFPIVESSVPFDIDRTLTEDEKKETVYYCHKDIEATIHLMYERRDYLATKKRLGARKDIPAEEAMYMTNAKLTAKYLGAVMQKHDDDFAYQFPDNILYQYIDKGVIEFFKGIREGDLLLEDKAKSYNGRIGNCEYRVGAGGIHGCNGVYNMRADDEHLILNDDVNQFYPSMIVENGYLSRNVPNPDDYKQVTIERKKAKAAGNKKDANSLKLVNNTTYGAQKNRYNALYDPLMALSICLSGQLYLLELATHLYQDAHVELIQLNTDGVMFRIHKDNLETAREILREWQERTHFTLEEDEIELIIQKDVNNYLERQVNGSKKVKGGALVRGISPVGAFSINNNATIIPDAIKAWFFDGIPVEKTIGECNDIFKFQYVAKASSKYKNVYHLQLDNGQINYVPVQRCNRVYASKNPLLGKLYKQKTDDGTKEQMASLPDNCIVDNDNKLSIDSINKSWYIGEAKRVIETFTQYKTEGVVDNMATKKEVTITPSEASSEMNIYQKLLKARIEFEMMKVQPSGYNGHADFDYYELADIVPAANKVFANNGLFLHMTFEEGCCVGHLIEMSTNQEIVFKVPHVHIAEPAKFRMNEAQALGAEMTYTRRYCYMLVLDITMADEIDADTKEAPVVKSVKTAPKTEVKTEPKVTVKPAVKVESKKPVSSVERKDIASSIVDSEGQADELQIAAIKRICKEWVELDPNAKVKVNEIVLKTNKFTTLSRKKAEALIDQLKKIVEKRRGEGNES